MQACTTYDPRSLFIAALEMVSCDREHNWTYCEVIFDTIVCMCVKLESMVRAFLTSIFTFSLFLNKQFAV